MLLVRLHGRLRPGDHRGRRAAEPDDRRTASGAGEPDPATRRLAAPAPIAQYVRDQPPRLTAGAHDAVRRGARDQRLLRRPGQRVHLQPADARPATPATQLVDFLQNKVGYCQQYAAAMGVMLRLAGVPARVVLGYTHSVPDASGTFTVTTNDAHAWVEAYFAGVGWVPFDPTPLAGISGGAASDLAWAPHGKSTPATTIRSCRGTAPAAARSCRARRPPNGAQRRRHPPGSRSTLPSTVLVVLGVLGCWSRSPRRWCAGAGAGAGSHQIAARRHRCAVGRARRQRPRSRLRLVRRAHAAPGRAAGCGSSHRCRPQRSLHTLTAAVERARYAPTRRRERRRELVATWRRYAPGWMRRSPRERMRPGSGRHRSTGHGLRWIGPLAARVAAQRRH